MTSHCTECSFCSFPYRTIVANFTINSSQLHLAIRESRVIFGEFFIMSRRGSEVLWPRRKNAAAFRYVSVLQATSKVSALYDVNTIPSNALSGFRRKSSRVSSTMVGCKFFLKKIIGALQVIHNIIVSFSSQTFTPICPLEEARGSNTPAC